ncbi:MAG: methyltransferase [Thermodesulfobacteriota bacterium]
MAATQFTEDTFFDGRIRVKQNARGYRFSIDAVILAWHIFPAANARIVDIGTGCGIIPLILAYRHRAVTIDALEIQPQLAALAIENVIGNHLEHRITVCCEDINQAAAKMPIGKYDLVVCNPPFRKSSTGRINPDPERAIARHEIAMTLAEATAAAGRLLRTYGEFAAVYPASRLVDMVARMRLDSIEPKMIRMIHSRTGDPAKLFIIKGGKKSRPGITIPPPLIIYHDDGTYTPEAQKMFAP